MAEIVKGLIMMKMVSMDDHDHDNSEDFCTAVRVK